MVATATKSRSARRPEFSFRWRSSHIIGIEIITTMTIAQSDGREPRLSSEITVVVCALAACRACSGIHTNQQTEAVRHRPYSLPLTYPPESVARLATAEPIP